MSDRSLKPIYLSLSLKRRALLSDWLRIAEINNRTDSGNYSGMTPKQTAEIDYILRDIREQI